jgi:hypothetical protein
LKCEKHYWDATKRRLTTKSIIQLMDGGGGGGGGVVAVMAPTVIGVLVRLKWKKMFSILTPEFFLPGPFSPPPLYHCEG